MSLRRKLSIYIGLVVLILGIGIFFGFKNHLFYKADTLKPEEQDFVPNQLIVKFKKDKTDSQIRDKIGKHLEKNDKNKNQIIGIKQLFKDKSQLSSIYQVDVNLDNPNLSKNQKGPQNEKQKNNTSALIDSLNLDREDIVYAEPNYIIKFSQIPNDPYYSDLWGLQKIQAPAAWDTITNTQSLTIAVIDTGVDYNHPDIKDNILRDSNGKVIGWSACGDNDPMDSGGHGTFVAGVIAAAGNNALGIVGVNWQAKIMPVKITCPDPLGYQETSNTGLGAEGIVWSVDHGAKISNNSWGNPHSQLIDDVVKYANQKESIVVTGAGNAGNDFNTSMNSPSGSSGAITVSAYDSQDKVAYFSSTGDKIDVGAPGVDILSLKASNAGCSRLFSNDYCLQDGTSFAAPFVTGVVALIWANNPNFQIEQVRQALRKGADDVGFPGWDLQSGFGRANAYRSLQITNPLASKIYEAVTVPGNNHLYKINGTAEGPNFSNYELAYAQYDPDSNFQVSLSWTNFASANQPVAEGELGSLDTTNFLLDKPYLVKLMVKNNNGEAYEDFFRLPGWAYGLKGWVRDAVTKQNIAGVEIKVVDLLDSNKVYADTTTALEGTFQQYLPLPVGQYVVEMTAAGYLPKSYLPLLDLEGWSNELYLTKNIDASKITGHIIDTVIRSPISGTTIKLTKRDEYFEATTQTDSEGSYTFNNLSDGNYNIALNATGYITTEKNYNSVFAQRTLIVDVNMTKATDAGSIRGKIVDSKTGTGVGSAQIGVRPSDNRVKIDAAYYVTSDSNGVYSYPGLPQGSYSMDIYAIGYNHGWTFINNIQVNAHQTTSYNASLQADEGTGNLSGKVINQLTGQPIAEAIVEVRVKYFVGNVVRSTHTDNEGNYTLNNLSSNGSYNTYGYILTAKVSGYKDSDPRIITVTPGQTIPDINFNLVPLSSNQVTYKDIATADVFVTGTPPSDVRTFLSVPSSKTSDGVCVNKLVSATLNLYEGNTPWEIMSPKTIGILYAYYMDVTETSSVPIGFPLLDTGQTFTITETDRPGWIKINVTEAMRNALDPSMAFILQEKGASQFGTKTQKGDSESNPYMGGFVYVGKQIDANTFQGVGFTSLHNGDTAHYPYVELVCTK